MSLTDDILAVGAEKRGIEEAGILRGVLGIMEATPTGKMILSDVAKIGTEIRMDPAFNGVLGNMVGGGTERGGKQVLISEKLYRECGIGASVWLLSVIAHEFQHVRQFRQSSVFGENNRVNPLMTNFRDGLFIVRFAEADAVSASAQVCFEAAAKGIRVWNGPVPYPGFTSYNSCFEAFAAEVRKSPASLADGRARKAAFNAWFGISDIKRRYEKEYLAAVVGAVGMTEAHIPAIKEQIMQLPRLPGGMESLLSMFPAPRLPVDAEKQKSLLNILVMPNGQPYLGPDVFTAPVANTAEPQSQMELEGIEKRLATLRRHIMPKPSQPPAPAPVIYL